MQTPKDNPFKRDVAFLVVACLLHGAILSANPVMFWGSAAVKPVEDMIKVEFVAVPPPTALLAPIPGGNNRKDSLPKHGPGAFKPERIKKPRTKFTAKHARKGLKPKKRGLTPEQKEAILRRRAEA